MYRRLIPAHLILALTLCAIGACSPPSNPGPTGTDTPGFAGERLQQIDDVIREEISAGKIPGAVAMVKQSGRMVYHNSFGYADIATKTAMQDDSIFRIASMTKAITTVAVMQLYEGGKFDLEEPISNYIPAFANPRVLVSTNGDGDIEETRAANSEIRIVDLLTHSAGISYAFIETPLQRSYKKNGVIDGLTVENISLESVMLKLAEQPLLFDPGTEWAYGLNTDLLGYLVEVVSGQTLNQYFAEHIFTPLGMEDTYFYLPDEKASRLVTLYADVDGLQVSAGDESSIYLDSPDYPIEGAMTYYSGGAGLSATAGDYLRFIEMLLNEGELDGERVLSRQSVELMRTPTVDSDNDGVLDFGLGFEVVTEPGTNSDRGPTGTYSWGGAFATSYWIDPANDLIAVVMTQQRPSTSDIRNKFRKMVYEAGE